MSNTRNLADLLDSGGDIKSAALDNVDVSGKLNTSGGTLTGTLTMESTDAGNSAAPELILYRNSASPASGDYLGQVQFKMIKQTAIFDRLVLYMFFVLHNGRRW